MKKSVRINVLVVTTVLACFVFIGIWYFRPAVSNELLQQARQRQLTPLLEIDRPMTADASEEEPVAPVVDQQALAEALLPVLKEDLSDSLASDPSFLASLSQQMEPAMVAALQPKMQKALDEYGAGLALGMDTEAELSAFRKALEQEYETRLAAERTALLATVDERIASSRDAHDAVLSQELDSRLASSQEAQDTAFSQQLSRRIDSVKQELSTQAEAYVPQLVDLLTPQVVAAIFNELETNRESYLSQLAEALKPYFAQPLTDDQIATLYASYRDRVIADIVPTILDRLEQPVAESVRNAVEALPASVPAAPASATVIESVPAPPVEQPIIAPPHFADSDVTVFLDPQDYETQRSTLRQQAIQSVLERLKDADN